MKLHRVWALTTRHLYLYRHSPVRLLEMIYWPFLDLLLWGFVSLYLRTAAGSAVPHFVAYFLGALILWDVLFRAQQGVSLAYLEEVWSRNLLNLFVSPLTIGEFIASTLVISVFKVLFAVFVMSTLGFFLYGFNILSLGLPLSLFFFALLVFGWALGIFTTGLILRLGQGAESLAWVVAFAVQPVACVFYPLAVLPGWLRPVALATPCAHVFEGMREVIRFHAIPWQHLAWALGLDALYLAAALGFFHLIFAQVRALGLLTKTGE